MVEGGEKAGKNKPDRAAGGGGGRGDGRPL